MRTPTGVRSPIVNLINIGYHEEVLCTITDHVAQIRELVPALDSLARLDNCPHLTVSLFLSSSDAYV